MNQEQLKSIIGLISGLQTAIVHLANIQAKAAKISTEAMAQSFETTAEAVPPSSEQQKVIQTVLNQIAAGIRSSAPDPEYTDLLNRLLH